jgi:hypothetical protein
MEALKFFPLAIVCLALYLGLSYFLLVDKDISGLNLVGLSRHIWVLAMELTVGVGAVFFIGSFASVIWHFIFVRALGAKSNFTKANSIFVFSLSISILLFMFGKWLTLLITNNAVAVSEFVSFNIYPPPFLIRFALDIVIAIVGIFLMVVCYFVASLPFKAKKHVQELRGDKDNG